MGPKLADLLGQSQQSTDPKPQTARLHPVVRGQPHDEGQDRGDQRVHCGAKASRRLGHAEGYQFGLHGRADDSGEAPRDDRITQTTEVGHLETTEFLNIRDSSGGAGWHGATI
jgi:hypothetical protein